MAHIPTKQETADLIKTAGLMLEKLDECRRLKSKLYKQIGGILSLDVFACSCMRVINYDFNITVT